MLNGVWTLLGSEEIGRQRRVRTLGLGAAVRAFNDLAVPGLGGIWFGKPLLWALLGITIAEHTSRQNIQVANAIEALACWSALDEHNWSPEPRLRGARKLKSASDPSLFSKVSRRSFYVSQPMRMQTVQPLAALGLVDTSSERFNAFRLSRMGEAFVEAATHEFRPRNKKVADVLMEWVRGNTLSVTPPLRDALSPLQVLSDGARQILRECLVRDHGVSDKAGRRRNALAWMDCLRLSHAQRQGITWHDRPGALTEEHWHDLHAGSRFFRVREAAIALLEVVEAALATLQEGALPLRQADAIAYGAETAASLRERAQAFLDGQHDPSPDRQATIFCAECTQADLSKLLETLVARDGRILRLIDSVIHPGPAFDRGATASHRADGPLRGIEDEGVETPVPRHVDWPEGLSHRMNNLFLLSLDLHSELDKWLSENDKGARA